VLEEQYKKVVVAGGRIAGPAAEALLANRMDQDTLDWLTTSFFKTGLRLGHCLRTPAKGPCECDLNLCCPEFFTTSEDGLRLRDRLQVGRQLIQDATERGWPPRSRAPRRDLRPHLRTPDRTGRARPALYRRALTLEPCGSARSRLRC
jgi:hypothetical protein